MSSEYGNFSSSTRGYGGGRARPDLGNRYYVRGGGRGRGGGSSPTTLSFPSEVDMKKGLDTSKVIETIPAPPRPSALEHVPIENVQYVASYNWIDTERPTIVVPGTGVLPSSSFERYHSQPSDSQPQFRFASCVDRARGPIHFATRRRLQFRRPEWGTYVRVPLVPPLRRRGRDA